MKLLSVFLSGALLLLFVGQYVSAEFAFSYQTFDVPGTTNSTLALGINDAGDLAGGAPSPAAFWRDSAGNFTPFAAPNATYTYALDVNNVGGIVGEFGSTVDGRVHGFSTDTSDPLGSFVPIDVPGSTLTLVHHITDSGVMLGEFSADPTSPHHLGPGSKGFIRDATGNFVPLEVPGSSPNGWTSPNSMNDAGDIVGVWTDAQFIHGFWRDAAGTYTNIDFPGFPTPFPQPHFDHQEVTAINNRGQMTGRYFDGSTRGWFRSASGEFSRVDVPGAIETQPWDMNDLGQITGWFMDNDGIHGFVATPIADHYSWVGEGSWHDTANWSPIGVPDTNWVVTVDNNLRSDTTTAVVDADSIVDSMNMLGTSGPMIVHVAEDITLEVTNGLQSVMARFSVATDWLSETLTMQAAQSG